MTSLTKLLTGTALAATLAFNSYSQETKLNCDTLYNDEKEIENVICIGKSQNELSSVYLLNYKNNEMVSRSELLYDQNQKISLHKRYEKDQKGNILLGWDFNGDGSFDKVLRKNSKKSVIEIDENNDGIFEGQTNHENYIQLFNDFPAQSLNEKYETKTKASEKIIEPKSVKDSIPKKIIEARESEFKRDSLELKITADSVPKEKKRIEKTELVGDLENVIVAYAGDIQDKKTKIRFNVDSLKSYNLYFESEKINIMDYLMKGKKPKEFKSDVRLYIVRKAEKETLVIPTTLEGGYDFSKDSKEKIKKEVRKFLKDEKITISDAVEYGSAEMFFELGEEE